MCVCVCVYEGVLVIKKNEILPFAAIWTNSEGIMLSEISQRQTFYVITYMLNLKNKNKLQKRNRLLDIQRTN